MKIAYYIIALLLSITPIYGAQRIKILERPTRGLRISYPNTAILESIVRQKISTRADTQSIIIKMKCYKKWRVKGRTKVKAYQCDPIELEADVPSL